MVLCYRRFSQIASVREREKEREGHRSPDELQCLLRQSLTSSPLSDKTRQRRAGKDEGKQATSSSTVRQQSASSGGGREENARKRFVLVRTLFRSEFLSLMLDSHHEFLNMLDLYTLCLSADFPRP